MSRNNPQRCSEVAGTKAARDNISAYTIPGKVFLLGEYAVLFGSPAIVAAVEPRFEMLVSKNHEADGLDRPDGSDGRNTDPHPESPAGLLLAWIRQRQGGLSELSYKFIDPYEGTGGFGASTAFFAMIYCDYLKRTGAVSGDFMPGDNIIIQDAFRLYKELIGKASGGAYVPSGADLLAQWSGGVSVPGSVMCTVQPTNTRKAGGSRDWQLIVFSAAKQAGRKVRTHEHLVEFFKNHESWRKRLIPILSGLINDGINAFENGDSVVFGKILNHYAFELHNAGLEIPATTEDRVEFKKLPGVLGVKGAGALQADALVVLVDEEKNCESVLDLGKQRGLTLISKGLKCVEGLSWNP